MDSRGAVLHIHGIVNPTTAVQLLARWAAGADAAAWEAEALSIAAHSLEDTVAAMVAGAGEPVSRQVRAAVPAGAVPLVGELRGSTAASSALANGTAAHCLELDEMFFVAGSHFGCAVVPAVLAVAYEQDASVDEVLDALIVGSELMARLGMAMGREHFEQGWHGTETLGVIAAAGACARLLRLDEAATGNALSLGVSMAAGAKVQFGTDAKPVQAGLAAHGGVLAATLAAVGVQGSAAALDGPQGFGELYRGSRAPDWSVLSAIGHEPLAIQRHGLAFKLYPNCASTHRCLDALAALRLAYDFRPDDVEHVEAFVGRVNLQNLRYPDPRTPREAMFSMQYALAVMLRRGAVTLADFTPQAVQDEATRSLMPRIAMKLDPRAGERMETPTQLLPHTTVVHLKNGRALSMELAHAKGSLANPFTAQERRAKFDQCTRGRVPADALKRLEALLGSPAGAKTRALMHLLQFPTSSSSSTETTP